MTTFMEMGQEFLAQKRIAVAGVSRTPQNTANAIYRKLRDEGYEVFPVNPHADEVEGDRCYASVTAVPGRLDGALLVTSPESTEQLVRDCAAAGISRVWMHENAFFKTGSSVSDEAVAFCRENGIAVIAGGCPMMFFDFGHKCMRWMLGMMGKLPEE